MTKRVLLAAAFSAAALLSAAGEARAQACGQPDDVPQSLFDTYNEAIGGLFPLDEPECEKIAASTLATCHKGVAAEVACWNQVIKGIGKGIKVACKAQGPDEAECLLVLGAELAGAELSLAQSEADGHEDCEVGADTFYLFCQNPF
jgi:hypothetical protein